jgi:3-hydroxyisobutyrate dehydrogenase-like beta-hydroxyacid dehydrogenase
MRPAADGRTAVGVVGLGAMGGPMAARLLDPGGFPVVVHDRVAERVAAVVARGATGAATAAAVAAASDVVITMLPDDAAVLDAVTAPDGILAALDGGTLVEMSTIDPETSRRVHALVREAGGRMLDAAVGRTSAHAVRGELSLMVGGDADLLEACRHVLEPMATTITHCGPAGAGSTMKLVNNLLTTSIVAANAEALTLAERAGLPREVVLRVLLAGAAANTHLAVTYQQHALADELEPGFATRLAAKDLGLALGLASRSGVPVPVGAAAAQLMTLALARGHAEHDFTSVLTALREVTDRAGDGP